MCGIAGIFSLGNQPISDCAQKLTRMNHLIAHRGPDATGIWHNQNHSVGLAHQRLSIIDLSSEADQPMKSEPGSMLVFNGAIYNYKDLQNSLKDKWSFKTDSDTETILAAYHAYGVQCLSHLRGMFAFAIADQDSLFCARDRFGIKPFYYAIVDNTFYFASEAKALLPFLPSIETEQEAFSEYITFQQPVSDKTLFKGISQLLPGYALQIKNGKIRQWKYWDVNYEVDHAHTEASVEKRFKELLSDSIDKHLQSDVAVGSYLSGGVDSSLITRLAQEHLKTALPCFHGRFTYSKDYDESIYAKQVANETNAPLHIVDIDVDDFTETLPQLIHHLDYPIAGPGAFPQYIVSKLASEHVKVVLGGQGGDEIFGGYARYIVGYLEQSLKTTMDGIPSSTQCPIALDALATNLTVLKNYKPMIKQFWRTGLFDKMDKRYFNLVDRSADFMDEINPEVHDKEKMRTQFENIFNQTNFSNESHFERMMHFDFKQLLPGLLHIEDRVSMAHGLEARVPFLDHPLVEFIATVPANIKLTNGSMKKLLKQHYADTLPKSIINRQDKMGFPVPLNEWMKNELKAFIYDTLQTAANRKHGFINYDSVIQNLEKTQKFSRKTWAFLSFELWHQAFHDKQASLTFEAERDFIA